MGNVYGRVAAEVQNAVYKLPSQGGVCGKSPPKSASMSFLHPRSTKASQLRDSFVSEN